MGIEQHKPVQNRVAARVLIGLAILGAAGVCAGAPASPAGRIVGTVFDVQTNQPLEGVNVQVEGTGVGATTGPDGSYVIDGLAPGAYQVRFTHIGYTTDVRTDVVVSAGAPARLDRGLIPAILIAPEITVRPRYFARTAGSPASRRALSREEVRRFPGGFEDVVRTVATLPGVAQVNEGGRNDLLVRGGGPSENLYLVQGLEVPNINHFGLPGTTTGSLSFINLDFVDNVEFSSGGFPARYGDRMSSVLSLDLRPGRDDRVGGKATISATQFGLAADGPLGRGTFRASVRRSYLDLIFKAAGQAFTPRYQDYNFFHEASLTSRTRLSVIGLRAEDRVERQRDGAEDRRQNASILGNEQDRTILGARLRHLIDGGYLQVSAGWNLEEFRLSQADTAEVAQTWFRGSGRAQEIQTTLEALRRWEGIGLLDAGLTWKALRQRDRTSFADNVFDRSGRLVPRGSLGLPARLDESTSALQAGAWVEGERPLAPRWTLRAGLRLDHYGQTSAATAVSPRATLAHEFPPGVTFRLSAGEYRQPPALGWMLQEGNEDLKPLRNRMAVAGGEWLLRDDTEISLEAFYKLYSDLPAGTAAATDSTSATDYLVLTNAGVGYGGREDDFQSFGYLALESRGSGEAFGVELQIQKKFSEIPCYGQAALSLGRSGFRSVDGRWRPGQFEQRYVFTVSGGYVFNPRWEISAKFRLAGGPPYTPVYAPDKNPVSPGEVQNLPDEYLSRRLPPAHQLDLRVDRRWNFTTWSLIAFTDIQNVYNYQAPSRPRYDFGEQEVVRKSSIALLPSVGLSAEF